MGALTYVVLKTVSSLMANCNVVNNLELFTLFGTNFFVLKISVNVSLFTLLVLLDLKLKHHLMRRFLS